MVDRITTQIDNSKIPSNIFLDLSKAFDTINHKILLDKLKYYGLEGPTLKLFNSYLTNREQCVELGDIKSKTFISTGDPQRSILGPQLFIIYINDSPQSSEMFNFITYVDDTTLSSTLNNAKNIDAGPSINDELGKINEWLEINKLSLNINKSRYMLFHMTNKQVNAPTLQISNTNIKKVN